MMAHATHTTVLERVPSRSNTQLEMEYNEARIIAYKAAVQKIKDQSRVPWPKPTPREAKISYWDGSSSLVDSDSDDCDSEEEAAPFRSAGWIMNDEEDKAVRKKGEDSMTPEDKLKALRLHRAIKKCRFFCKRSGPSDLAEELSDVEEVDTDSTLQHEEEELEPDSQNTPPRASEKDPQQTSLQHPVVKRSRSDQGADQAQGRACKRQKINYSKTPQAASRVGTQTPAPGTEKPRGRGRPRTRPVQVYCPTCQYRKDHKSRTGAGKRAGNKIHNCEWCALQQDLANSGDPPRALTPEEEVLDRAERIKFQKLKEKDN